MRAGTLREQFTVKTVTRGTAGSFGAPSLSTGTAGTLWGHAAPAGGREGRAVGANTEEADYVVTVRAQDADSYTLTASGTYLLNDETNEALNVTAVLRDGGVNAVRTLLCTVRSQDGDGNG